MLLKGFKSNIKTISYSCTTNDDAVLLIEYDFGAKVVSSQLGVELFEGDSDKPSLVNPWEKDLVNRLKELKNENK